MLGLQVVCKCGLQSETAVWGPAGLFNQGDVGMPVYLPASGELFTHWFDMNRVNVSPPERDEWLCTRGRDIVREQYGKDCVLVGPPDGREAPLYCPRCRQNDARVEIVGIH
jgi:hypothetical protein